VTVLLILSSGATVFANACGCIGMWIEKVLKKERNTIVHSFNRNFSSAMETQTQVASGSPELVTAMAIAGDLGFNL
jgi:aconitate hydratase